MLTVFEARILMSISTRTVCVIGGNKAIAITAAANRLVKKGMVIQIASNKFAISEAGKRYIAETEKATA